MNTRQKVLEDALKIVNGEREKQYGSPEDNFARIADFWGLYLTTLFDDNGVVIELDPKDVAIMMILFKIARSLGDQDKLDNYIDIIGYAACGAEIFEKGEAIDSSCDEKANAFDQYGTNVLLDKKDPYSYAHNKLSNYISIKANEEHVPLDKLKDVNRKFPRELEEFLDHAATDCAENGKRILDCYKEIDELFAKYVNKNKPDNEQKDACDHAAYVSKGAIEIHKFVEDNRLSMDFDFEKSPKGRDIFNDAARAFIAGIGNSNVKITTFEAPKDWYLYDVFMNETGQIIVRFNTRKTKELTGIPSCDECLYGTQDATDDPCNKCLCDIHHKPFFIPKNKKDNKYGSEWQAYQDILACILDESSKANVHPFDVVEQLIINDHASTEMALLLVEGKISFDDVTSYVEDAINELKKEETPKTTYKILKMTEDDKGVYLTVKEDSK